VLATLVSTVVALTSCYLGPFALVPTCGAIASVLFVPQVNRRERPLITGIFVLGVLAPFLTELFGIGPPAYAFEADRIVIFARGIALPRGATFAAMIYSSAGFPILAMYFLGKMRDRIEASEKRHFIQGWYLRHLFPGAAKAGAT
jgi:hypothetical protein